MLNSVIMTGRMVADPELRTTQSDIKVTSFRIAVTRNYKVNDEYPSDFFTVVAWRNTAEFAARHFKKGDSLTVQGRAEVRKFTDKDGNETVKEHPLINIQKKYAEEMRKFASLVGLTIDSRLKAAVVKKGQYDDTIHSEFGDI